MMSGPRVISLVFAFVLLGCTPVGYVKPDVSDEQIQQDLTNCTEIARDQAFRDLPALEFRLELHRPSSAELAHRYRRVCMLARGYELAPVQP